MINKIQFQRLGLICRAIESLHEPSKENIRKFINEESEYEVCDSTIEKDIFLLRNEFEAPIKFRRGVKVNNIQYGFYYMTEPYSYEKYFLQYWDSYISFSDQIKEIIYEKTEIKDKNM